MLGTAALLYPVALSPVWGLLLVVVVKFIVVLHLPAWASTCGVMSCDGGTVMV